MSHAILRIPYASTQKLLHSRPGRGMQGSTAAFLCIVFNCHRTATMMWHLLLLND